MFTTVNYEYADLFTKDMADKQLRIVSDDGLINITNTEIHQQQFELTENLCTKSELRFGSCETSTVKFTVSNTFIPLTGKWITITMVIEGRANNPFQIGRYKVFSDAVTADRTKRNIIAYDVMHDILNADMSAWYNSLFPKKESMLKLKQFRTSFMNHFGLQQVLPQDGLVNDNMLVGKTIEPDRISGKDIITAICEINGCFGHIGRDGKFHYIYLPQAIQGLYPANNLFPDHAPDYLPYQQRTGHLYPQDPKSTRVGANGTYIEVDWEKFLCKSIDKLQIRKEENDIGTIVGRNGDNCYIIEDNFLVYGKGSEELQQIANKIFNKITDVTYLPLISSDIKGNPCFEVGDPIRISTKYQLIETYILERTLKGIQALRDSYKSNGVEKYSEKVNGIHRSIVQLKGKTNVIVRTVEENRMEMINITDGLSNTISVTAAQIRTELKAEQQRAEGEEAKLSNSIKVTAEGLQANITKEQQRAEGEETKLSTSISALAGQIVLKVNSNGEIASVRLEASPDTGTVFKVKAGNIQLSAEEAINLLSNGTLALSAKNITIKSDNFSVSPDGTTRCKQIIEFGISGNAIGQFNSAVSDSEAMRVAREAISAAHAAAKAAAQAAEVAKRAADSANSAHENLRNTIIPEINSSIDGVSVRVASLENRVAILESKP